MFVLSLTQALFLLGYEEEEVWEEDNLTTGNYDDFVKEDTLPTDDIDNYNYEIEISTFVIG